MTSFTIRVAAGIAVLLGGSVHLERWLHGYRELSVGPMFALNVIASVVVATALFALPDRWPVLAGLALSAGSLVAIVLSRTVGLLGYEETGYDRAAIEAIVFEAIALALLTASLLITDTRAPHPTPTPGHL